MFRLTPLLLTIPLVFSLGIVSPAKADCTRYKGWKDGSYGWWSDCTERYRNYDNSFFRLHRRSSDSYYPRLRRHRDFDERNNRWNSRYDRDWRDNGNRRNWDYNDDWRYNKNPGLRIFLGF
jgi:hypothetical protein